MFHAVGKPGEPVARYATNPDVLQLAEGEVVIEVGELPDVAQLISVDGTAVEPVELDLSSVRAAAWNRALAYRNLRRDGGCASPKGRVDSDADSRALINGAVTMAMLAQATSAPFAMPWTMADNSVVAHDASEMIALGAAVGQFIAACQVAGTTIRAAISTADSATAVANVDITAGYPPQS